MLSYLKKWCRIKQEVEKQKLNPERLPIHIAIIMDGNGRWAKQRGLPRVAGHRAGVEALRDIVKACTEWGIKVLTVYAFSTENWKRPQEEIEALMNLLVEYIRKELLELHKEGIKIRAIGRIESLPAQALAEIMRAVKETEKNDRLILNLALNYGGRAELVDAFKTIAGRVAAGEIRPEDIDEKLIANSLYTRNMPDPDLLIRPSGEMRLSNFLLWQLAYTELWITDIYWPDFRREHLREALLDYQKRERRFGGLKI